jgi:Sugar-binding cellulase-like
VFLPEEGVMSEVKNSQPKAGLTTQGLSRRLFLKSVGQSALSIGAISELREVAAIATESRPSSPKGIPAHLPPRLTIALWIWSYLTACGPGEPYEDLDRAFTQTVERGFNTIRAEMALNWCFDRQGQPRGQLEIGAWATGVNQNLRGLNNKGGLRYDVLEKVLKMFELARKHKVFVIATSWEYQDSNSFMTDAKLRQDIDSTPREDRFERLADMHDRLIQELKKHGLEKQIAFVEIHNELNASEFPSGFVAQKPLVEKALSRLQKAHPDILFTADYTNVGPAFDGSFPGYDALPGNLQVADHHIYAGGVEDALSEQLDLVQWNQISPDPKNNPLLRWLIGEKPSVSWEEWSKQAEHVRTLWWPVQWLYANLKEPDRYDYWMFEHFGQYAAMMRRMVQAGMREWGNFARSRGLPAVIDEGYFSWPPLNSRFEESAAIRQLLEMVVDTAIEQKYWGMMLTTYCAPDEPIWMENPDWLRKNNQRFLNSAGT